MKRLFSIFMALVYLTVSSGFTVEVHYCMGQMVGAGIPALEDGTHTCSQCGMDQKSNNGCCHDELKLLKSHTDQVIGNAIQLPSGIFLADIPPVFSFRAYKPKFSPSKVAQTFLHDPPLPGDGPIYLKVRNLRL